MSFVRLPSPTINVKRVQDGDGFLTRDTNKNPILARIVLNAKQYARLEPTLLAGFAAAVSSGWLKFRMARDSVGRFVRFLQGLVFSAFYFF
jgi:hypothetical protein